MSQKEYKPSKIPELIKGAVWRVTKEELMKNHKPFDEADELFAEIEIASGPADEGFASPCVPEPQPIKPCDDENRLLFRQLRDIAYDCNVPKSIYGHSLIFYRQAEFMAGHRDNFPHKAHFSSYYPYYQMMNYDQLRTYFTWRTKVRDGCIEKISASYAFLYVYELLHNIGCESHDDALNRLYSFWQGYREHDEALDKYMVKWLRDYHIYYPVEKSFKSFAFEKNLQAYFPQLYLNEADKNSCLEIYGKLSKYNIFKSAFYTDENRELVKGCFYFLINELRKILAGLKINMGSLLYKRSARESAWSPFSGALFCPMLRQQDRQVQLADNVVYTCSRNKWSFKSLILNESGVSFITYIIKRMEFTLREETGFKGRISAGTSMIDGKLLERFEKKAFSIEKETDRLVKAYLMLINRKTVSVDLLELERIRRQALDTQQKLIVEEPQLEEISLFAIAPPEPGPEKPAQAEEKENVWLSLIAALSPDEYACLEEISKGGSGEAFARAKGLMAEVLIDGINEKAYDITGDILLDTDSGSAEIYADYRDGITQNLKQG